MIFLKVIAFDSRMNNWNIWFNMNFSTQVFVKCSKMGKKIKKFLSLYLLLTLLEWTNLIKIIKGKSFSRSIGNGTSSSITNYYESIHCEIDILFFFYIFYIYLLGFYVLVDVVAAAVSSFSFCHVFIALFHFI